MTTLPNPLIPGFNPDPSITEVDGTYYLVTSTFEYLPGLPVYKSADLVTWTQIGAVATRSDQLQITDVPTLTGAYAPTIRHRDGVFYVIVTVMLSPRSCVVFTATDPAGPWSDGIDLPGVKGIDPDLAWDEQGTALVTYSTGDDVQQVAVDLTTGETLEGPRPMWSGTGLASPESPHLYLRDGQWYLLLAEGGTERGHAVSVARGVSPRGPFESCPHNPVLTASGTTRSVQATGHADLVETPDGTCMVLLGTRPVGAMYKFSPLGRETFVTSVAWHDGWPVPAPVEAAPDAGVDEHLDLLDPTSLEAPGWLGVRHLPDELAVVTERGLELNDGGDLDDLHPRFLGRRQRHLRSVLSVELDVTSGAGGLALRYDEWHWLSLVAERTGERTTVTARAQLSGLAQTWTAELTAATVVLHLETLPPLPGTYPGALHGDTIRLAAGDDARHTVEVVSLNGKYWSTEACPSFTGRVTGLYARSGDPVFRSWHYRGCDHPHDTTSEPRCPLHQETSP